LELQLDWDAIEIVIAVEEEKLRAAGNDSFCSSMLEKESNVLAFASSQIIADVRA
jgi:hypothetical protein